MSDLPSDQVLLAKQWVLLAEEDLKNAEHTLKLTEDCPLTTVCFHAQQGVEKYIKALLVFKSIEFPRIHDIGELVQLLPAGVGFPLSAEEQQRLTDYAVVNRYPGEWEPLEREEGEEAVVMARKVRATIRKYLPE